MKQVNITNKVTLWLAFREYILAISEYFQNQGWEVLYLPDIDMGMLNIVLGAAHTPEYYLEQTMPPNTIIVNLEQCYDASPWNNPSYLALLSKYPVWDYSKANIEWLEERGIKAQLFRIFYSSLLETIPVRENKDIDVLFIGAEKPRRNLIRDALQNHPQVGKVVFGEGYWGIVRDNLISRSKIVLNIHGYSGNIFESSRVLHLLCNKAFVITEESVDDKDYPTLEGGLVRTSYDEMVDKVVEFLQLPRERERISRQGYQAVRNTPSIIPFFTVEDEKQRFSSST